MDSDYKKYSLQKLEEWVHDALSAAEASPQEIYDVIKGVVDENYHMHKLHASRCYELLALLNGNGKGHISCDKDVPSEECKKSWSSFWKNDTMPPWGHGDLEALKYTDEELNAMCDAEEEKQKKTLNYQEAIAAGWEMTADGFWLPPQKKDKVVKWQLPVQVDGLSGDCFVEFPDDLLEAANLKEGDAVNWVDNKDGSYTLTKVTKPLTMDEC